MRLVLRVALACYLCAFLYLLYLAWRSIATQDGYGFLKVCAGMALLQLLCSALDKAEVRQEDRERARANAAQTRALFPHLTASMAALPPVNPSLEETREAVDPFALASIVTHPNELVRRAAADNPNLTDQVVLAYVARHDEDLAVRLTALAKLTDQALRLDIARWSNNEQVSIAAAAGLTDQRTITNLATGDVPAQRPVRLFLIKHKVTDEALLLRLATADPDAEIRKGAICAARDQATLTRVATTSSDWGDREAAVERLTGASVLAAIAQNAPGPRIRRSAIENPYLNDLAVLARIVRMDADFGVRKAAAVRLDDKVVLERVLHKEAEHRRDSVRERDHDPDRSAWCPECLTSIPLYAADFDSWSADDGWVEHTAYRCIQCGAVLRSNGKDLVWSMNR